MTARELLPLVRDVARAFARAEIKNVSRWAMRDEPVTTAGRDYYEVLVVNHLSGEPNQLSTYWRWVLESRGGDATRIFLEIGPAQRKVVTLGFLFFMIASVMMGIIGPLSPILVAFAILVLLLNLVCFGCGLALGWDAAHDGIVFFKKLLEHVPVTYKRPSWQPVVPTPLLVGSACATVLAVCLLLREW
jgi:hypothetical protein